jgi:hypothetical protein
MIPKLERKLHFHPRRIIPKLKAPRERNAKSYLFHIFAPQAFDASHPDCYYQIAGWSSLVARWAHNPKVASSNLAPATKTSYQIRN